MKLRKDVSATSSKARASSVNVEKDYLRKYKRIFTHVKSIAHLLEENSDDDSIIKNIIDEMTKSTF